MGWRVVILVLLGTVPAISFTAPQNTASQKDATNTEIACEIPSHATVSDKAWFKTSEAGTQIADNSGIITAQQTDYELVSDGNKWDLKIKKALVMGDADKYICKTGTAKGTARLVLVDTPSCTLANKETDKVTFSCTTTYGGAWPPTAVMKDDADGNIGTAVAGSGGTLARDQDITVTASNDGHNYKCEMGFVANNNPDNSDNDAAKNVPDTSDAIYKCSITAVKPSGVTITSGGAESELVKDDILTCAASTAGVPTASIKWTDPDGGELVTTTTYTVTDALVGKTVTCSVSNNIGSSSTTFPASTEVSTSTETPETTSQESSGRMAKAIVGELGITILVALLGY